LRFLLPVSNYDGLPPLNEDLQKRFSLLDTFDALAAPYAHCVTERQFCIWLKTAGLSEIEILPGGMMAARARKRVVAHHPSVGKNRRPRGVEAESADTNRVVSAEAT
jgi:hypothetical protein